MITDETSVRLIRPEPGDVIIMECQSADYDHLRNVKEAIQEFFPDNRVLVCGLGTYMGVFNEDKFLQRLLDLQEKLAVTC